MRLAEIEAIKQKRLEFKPYSEHFRILEQEAFNSRRSSEGFYDFIVAYFEENHIDRKGQILLLDALANHQGNWKHEFLRDMHGSLVGKAAEAPIIPAKEPNATKPNEKAVTPPSVAASTGAKEPTEDQKKALDSLVRHLNSGHKLENSKALAAKDAGYTGTRQVHNLYKDVERGALKHEELVKFINKPKGSISD